MIGTEQVVLIFSRLTRGEGQERDLDLLKRIATEVQTTARCRRGIRAASVLAESLEKSDVYEEHAREKHCPSGSCSGLVHYRVIPDKCTMCGLCKEACPRGAIVGEEYLPYLADNEPYYIKVNKCDNCGLCLPACEAGAIELF
jgi:NAD-dependent dihydropyrimidine dehydrogenase PreA subunit